MCVFAPPVPTRPTAVEILTLKDFDAIPSSILETYDGRTIGEAIVQRINNKDSGFFGNDTLTRKPFDLMGGTSIQLHFSQTSSIVKNGFLNQHQTGTSMLEYDPDKRLAFEEVLSGLAWKPYQGTLLWHAVSSLLPKYASLDVADEQIKFPNAPTQFPGLIAVLKDEVKFRSTFTNGDSLRTVQGERQDFLRKYRRDNQRTFSWNQIETGSKNPNYHPSSGYWEAQVFGPLDVRDVAYFILFGDAVPTKSEQTPEEFLALRATGLPIYRGRVVLTKNKRKRIVASEEIYSGAPEKIESYVSELQKSRKGISESHPLHQLPQRPIIPSARQNFTYTCRIILQHLVSFFVE